MVVGLGAPLGSQRRVIYDTSDSNAVYVVSSVDAVEFQLRDSRWVDKLAAGQAPGTKKVTLFSHVG